MEDFFGSMPVWMSALLFLVGIFLITKGADWFTDGAVGIASATGIPKVVVGATIVSLATTLPEFGVSATAAFLGRPQTSVGNAVGSTICNIGLILAVAAFISPARTSMRSVRTEGFFMLALGVVLVLMARNGTLGRGEGVLLLFVVPLFLWMSVRRSEASAREPGDGGEAPSVLLIGLRFLLGAVLVVGGSVLLVQTAIALARAMGVPELVIALTLVAVGTSLPELITAVASSRRGHSDIAVGNVMGANVLNIAWVVGGSAAILPLAIERQTQILDFPFMLGMMLVFLLAAMWNNRIGRRYGLVFSCGYIAYLVLMIVYFV